MKKHILTVHKGHKYYKCESFPQGGNKYEETLSNTA